MVTPEQLSRRERQIMDAVYALGRATVNEVVETMNDPPSPMAVRRTMHILVEKGFLKGRKQVKEVIYSPRKSKSKVGKDAMKHVIETFFGGSVTEAMAVCFSDQRLPVDAEEREKLIKLIQEWEQSNDDN